MHLVRGSGRLARGVLGLIALSLPLVQARAARAEVVSVALDDLVGTYVLDDGGRRVQFDLGMRFLSVRSASLAITGSGTPGLFQRCPPASGGQCFPFQLGPSALYIVESEGPTFWPFYGSVDFSAVPTTHTRLLVGEPEDRAVFLDGRGELVLTHNGIVSIPEDPIYVLEPWEFTVTQFVLSVDGMRWRGVDFEDVPVAPGTLSPRVAELSSGGYRFTSPGGGLRRSNRTLSADNGTTYLVQDPGEGAESIALARADARPFSLPQFDASEWDGTATHILVRGLRADGSRVERAIELDGIFDGAGSQRDFETIALDADWVQLVQVEFAGQPVGLGGGLFALDELAAPPAEDLDQDGTDDAFDTCPELADPEQGDRDGNGVGDGCNDFEDTDGDDWAGPLDNCPLAANGDQGNRDADALGDVCDRCPDYAVSANNDRDGNGIGDPCECGDQNQDGTVSVADLTAINQAIFGSAPVTPLCDTNQDGLCNVSDIVGANRKTLGWPAYCARFPRPSP
jgi:hypothetical protein